MHAVIVNVKFSPEKANEAQQWLHEKTLPRVKEMPGVVRGFWTRSAEGAQGTSMVVFSSREDADNAASIVPKAAPPSATIEKIEVREVIADV